MSRSINPSNDSKASLTTAPPDDGGFRNFATFRGLASLVSIGAVYLGSNTLARSQELQAGFQVPTASSTEPQPQWSFLVAPNRIPEKIFDRSDFVTYFQARPYELPILWQAIQSAQLLDNLEREARAPRGPHGLVITPFEALYNDLPTIRENQNKLLWHVTYFVDDLKHRAETGEPLYRSTDEVKRLKEGLDFAIGSATEFLPAGAGTAISLVETLQLYRDALNPPPPDVLGKTPAQIKTEASKLLEKIGNDYIGKISDAYPLFLRYLTSEIIQDALSTSFPGKFQLSVEALGQLIEANPNSVTAEPLRKLRERVIELQKEGAKPENSTEERKAELQRRGLEIEHALREQVNAINKGLGERLLDSFLLTPPQRSEQENAKLKQMVYTLEEAQGAVTIASLLIQFVDPEIARSIQVIGSSTIQMGLGIATAIAHPLLGASEILKGAFGFMGLGGRDVGAERHQQVMEALGNISQQITQLQRTAFEIRRDIGQTRVEMHERFNDLNRAIFSLRLAVLDGFSTVLDRLAVVEDKVDLAREDIGLLKVNVDRSRRENARAWVRERQSKLIDAEREAFSIQAYIKGIPLELDWNRVRTLSIEFAGFGYDYAGDEMLTGANWTTDDLWQFRDFRAVPFPYSVGFVPKLFGPEGIDFQVPFPHVVNPSSYLESVQAYLRLRAAYTGVYTESPENLRSLISTGHSLERLQSLLTDRKLLDHAHRHYVSALLDLRDAVIVELQRKTNVASSVQPHDGAFVYDWKAVREEGVTALPPIITKLKIDISGKTDQFEVDLPLLDPDIAWAIAHGLGTIEQELEFDAREIDPEKKELQRLVHNKIDQSTETSQKLFERSGGKNTQYSINQRIYFRPSVGNEASFGVAKEERVALGVRTLAFADVHAQYLGSGGTCGWELMHTFADFKRAWEGDYEYIKDVSKEDVAYSSMNYVPDLGSNKSPPSTKSVEDIIRERRQEAWTGTYRAAKLRDIFNKHATTKVDEVGTAKIHTAVAAKIDSLGQDFVRQFKESLEHMDERQKRLSIAAEALGYVIRVGWMGRLDPSQFQIMRHEDIRTIATEGISPNEFLQALNSKIALARNWKMDFAAASVQSPVDPLPTLHDLVDSLEFQLKSDATELAK